MKKSDLENGMILELRKGYQFMLIKDFTKKSNRNTECNDILISYKNVVGYMALDDYDENLLNIGDDEFSRNYDIVKIYYLKGCGNDILELLWEREEIALTDDEKFLLKISYEQGYKWIIKDTYGGYPLFFENKPEKLDVENDESWWYDKNMGRIMCIKFKNIFNFIKHDDKEPYNIEELLKEN